MNVLKGDESQRDVIHLLAKLRLCLLGNGESRRIYYLAQHLFGIDAVFAGKPRRFPLIYSIDCQFRPYGADPTRKGGAAGQW